MRPVKLSIEGLRSFREPQVISFDGRDHIAIIGDTGAGKSSILEAMSYALYGRLTYTGSGNQQIMNDVSSLLRVIFEFDVGGERWRVTRVLKRAQRGAKAGEVGSPSVSLERLDAAGAAVESFEGRSAVDTQIEQVLGLDHDAFTTTVVLPQGKFARLLLAEDKIDRRAILKQIWPTHDLERVGVLADEHLGRLRELNGALKASSAEPDGDRPALLAEIEAASQRLAATQQAHDAAEPIFDDLDRLASQAERLATVRAAADRFDAAELVAVAEGVEAERARAAHGRDAARVAVAAAEAALRDQPDVDHAAFERLADQIRSLRAAAEKQADLAAAVEQRQTQVESLRLEVSPAQEAAARAAQALADADAALLAAQRSEAAAHAAEGHKPGDPCPVCSQTLPQTWAPPTPASIHDAKQRRVAAQKDDNATSRAAADLQARLDAASRQLDEARTALAEADDALRARSDPSLDDLLAREADLKAQSLARRTLERELARHSDALAQAELALARAGQAAMATIHQASATHLAALVELAGQINVPTPTWQLDDNALVASVHALGDETRVLATQADSLAERLAGDRQAATRSLGELFETIAIDLPPSPARARSALARAVAESEHRANTANAALARYDEAVARAARVHDAQAKLEAVIAVLNDLKLSLTDKAFPGWLAMRRSRGLLAAASRLLGDMSSGRYGFADHEEDWLIIDRDTGESRSPASLSGGEKFIASLALALAMVEMVKGTGGKLEALFLDEGFGALDRSNLDSAIEALEQVAASGRMVAVITHIAAVAEEVRDVLEVRASPKGSQVRWLTAEERSSAATRDVESALAGLIH